MTGNTVNLLLQTNIRSATRKDQPLIEEMYWDLHYENRHLDWRNLTDWLDTPNFLVLENKWHKLISILVCPQDPPGVAWVKLFVIRHGYNRQEVWDILFSKLLELLGENQPIIASVALSDWYVKLLEQKGFEKNHELVWLRYDGVPEPLPVADEQSEFSLRVMSEQDLSEVQRVDEAAFDLIWQLSSEGLTAAMQHASYATVLEWKGQVIAYQISSSTAIQAHLSRLAVLPEFQGIGLGKKLLNDLIRYYRVHHHIRTITVNTHSYNQVALSLYQKTGFQLTGEKYPVYLYNFTKA
ncbi:MAG: GNAT family N-acetyltransferase [Anaerolineales bacterium]